MKTKNLIVIVALILSGCVGGNQIIKGMEGSDYGKHPVAFEVVYDLVCVVKGGGTFTFKRGTQFAPKDVGGVLVRNTNGSKMSVLPKHSIALLVDKPANPIGGEVMGYIYTFIYPDGNFVLDYQLFNALSDGTFKVGPKSKDLCKIKGNVPAFKRIIN